jgi:hypothetical protein
MARESGVTKPLQKKHYSFYLSQLMLAMIALLVSWDVIALSLALPVRITASGKALSMDTAD